MTKQNGQFVGAVFEIVRRHMYTQSLSKAKQLTFCTFFVFYGYSKAGFLKKTSLDHMCQNYWTAYH